MQPPASRPTDREVSAAATARSRSDAQEPGSSALEWRARLELELDHDRARTRLRHVEHRGPLRIQRPFYPEPQGVCHIYVLHPPGGLATGDRLEIEARVLPHAHALITAPAAQKLYRCPTHPSRQAVRLSVRSGALEWLPQETIAFDGARSKLDLRVDLDASARFIGWEVLSLGRPASAECFTRGGLDQRIEITRSGRITWLDRLRIDPAESSMSSAWGLQGRTTVGTLVCTPALSEWVSEVRSALRAHVDPARELCDVTCVGDLIVVRFLGDQALRARACFMAAWQVLRPLAMARSACAPRIWST